MNLWRLKPLILSRLDKIFICALVFHISDKAQATGALTTSVGFRRRVSGSRVIKT